MKEWLWLYWMYGGFCMGMIGAQYENIFPFSLFKMICILCSWGLLGIVYYIMNNILIWKGSNNAV